MAKKSIEEITESSKKELRKEKSGAALVAMLELSDFINWSGIASEVFKKKPAWILQRLHGYEVNGKPARFKPEEYDRLAEAMVHVAELLRKNAEAIRQAAADEDN